MKNNLIIKKCMSCGAIVKVLKDCTCNNCGIKCCGEEMQILLPNSVDAAIEKHVPTYEKVEDEILVNNYTRLGPTDCAALLEGRTVVAIKNRAQSLGLIFRKEMFGWTDEEMDILRKYYPIEGKRVAARLPNRTISTIQVTAHRAGIKRHFHS